MLIMGCIGQGCCGSDLNNSALLLDCSTKKGMNSNVNGLPLFIMDGDDTEWRVPLRSMSM